MTLFNRYLSRYEESREETISLQAYLDLCKRDSSTYASAAERLLMAISAAERLLMAIGEPEMVDTRNDPRLSRIFQNKVLKIYPAFEEFYGMEDPIEQIVSYLKHAAQGLEEKKQILYLLGPVGGGKSSLAERLKQLMERVSFYAIEGSPVFESPLGLFNPEEDGQILEDDYGIPRRYLRHIMSPWAAKRLREYNGDITKFRVVTSPSSAWSSYGRRCCTRSPSPRPSRAMRTTRISPRWWVRWISASWNISLRTIRMPTVFPVLCAAPTAA